MTTSLGMRWLSYFLCKDSRGARSSFGWRLSTRLEGGIHPLIFSRSPAAFDEQIAFTLRAYWGGDWELLQKEERPSYGDPRLEAETAVEDVGYAEG